MVEPESRHNFLAWLQGYYATCQLWSVQTVPAVQKQPVASAIPTLILSGEYDPATPPADGKLAAQTLSKSYFFLFPGTGHGVLGTNSCATSLFETFLDLPARQPDATCMSEVGEPFNVSFASHKAITCAHLPRTMSSQIVNTKTSSSVMSLGGEEQRL